MIKFDVITIFPTLIEALAKESLLKRAQKKKLLQIKVHDLRRWAKNKHKTVDDKPFGGGLGMVMKIEPIYKAIRQIRNPKSEIRNKYKILLFTPRGKKFTQKMAYEFSKFDQLIMICGRYEGVDERVATYIAHEQLSVGDYDLMGGEVPAMTVIETVARLIPGVIGKSGFLKARQVKKTFIEYPQYTRPEVFEGWKVPKLLLSGNHKKIEQWRAKHGRVIGN